MNTPWAPEDGIVLTPAGQGMASAVPASGGMSDHDLANVAQAVYFAVQSGDAAGAIARLRDLTISASNLAFEGLAKSHGECDELRAQLAAKPPLYVDPQKLLDERDRMREVASDLVQVVEGPAWPDFRDSHGVRLKDYKEWCAFYCATRNTGE